MATCAHIALLLCISKTKSKTPPPHHHPDNVKSIGSHARTARCSTCENGPVQDQAVPVQSPGPVLQRFSLPCFHTPSLRFAFSRLFRLSITPLSPHARVQIRGTRWRGRLCPKPPRAICLRPGLCPGKESKKRMKTNIRPECKPTTLSRETRIGPLTHGRTYRVL